MFPAKCRKPPCTNIEVSTVTQENAAGINPNRMMNSWTWAPIENSRKKTSALMTRIETVTKGVVREGMTSRSGIIGGVGYQESGIRNRKKKKIICFYFLLPLPHS